MSIRIPILTYHSIDDSGSVISTPLYKFREQMQILRDKQFSIISLNDLVDLIRNKQSLVDKTAVITFDDGFKNFYLEAYPVLQEFGFSATVFLVPGYIGKTSEWNAGLRGLPVLDLLGWDEVREMVKNGIDFGAHTMTHRDLTKLPVKEIHREISQSKLAIQDHFERDNILFAYPYGRLCNEVKTVIKEEFYGACSTGLGLTSLGSDVYALPRIDMYYFSRNRFFAWSGTSYFPYYIKFRSIFRSLKGL